MAEQKRQKTDDERRAEIRLKQEREVREARKAREAKEQREKQQARQSEPQEKPSRSIGQLLLDTLTGKEDERPGETPEQRRRRQQEQLLSR